MRDHYEQALAYIYYEEEPGRRSAAKLLTKDEARRITYAQLATTLPQASLNVLPAPRPMWRFPLPRHEEPRQLMLGLIDDLPDSERRGARQLMMWGLGLAVAVVRKPLLVWAALARLRQ